MNEELNYKPPKPPIRNNNNIPTVLTNLQLPPTAITKMNRLGRGINKASNYLTPKLESGLGSVVNKVNQLRERDLWEEGISTSSNSNVSSSSSSTTSSNLLLESYSSNRSTSSITLDTATTMNTSNVNSTTSTSRGWGVPGLSYFSAESKEKRNELYIQSFQEHITSFGGHACLRPSSSIGEPALVIEMIASGSAFRERPIEKASRSQRVFYSLAKSFAALPRLPDQTGLNSGMNTPANQSVESFSTGLEEAEASVGNALERLMEVGGGEGGMEEEGEFGEAVEDVKHDNLSPPTPPLQPSTSTPTPTTASTIASSTTTTNPLPTTFSYTPQASSLSKPSSSTKSFTNDSWPKPFTYTDEDLPRLHSNLNSRLLPFFGQKLPGRKVRVSIYPVLSPDSPSWEKPLVTKVITTSLGGNFKTNLSVPSKEIKKLLDAGVVEGGINGLEGMELKVVAELLEVEKVGENLLNNSILGFESLKVNDRDSRSLLVGKDGGVRLISDIDDTVKWTEVLGGTRKIFRNVFVRELNEIIVPGMAKWYTALANRGAEIHYASNGPQELFPVISKFLDLGGFPLGSITLKEYGSASSTLSKLFEEPGERKRAAVENILIEFPYCRFILVGDSGEKDLDLYLALAHQYPKQILAIYIRDVTTPFDPDSYTSSSISTTPPAPTSVPPSLQDLTLEDPTSDALSPNNPILKPETTFNHTEESQFLMDTWLDKLKMAKENLPKGVILKVFRHGDECREESLKFMRGS